MAILLTTSIAGSLSTQFAPQLERQFRRGSTLFNMMRKTKGAGANVAWDVRFSRATPASAMAEGADVTPADVQFDITQPASLGWATYRSVFGISGLAMATATSAAGSPLVMLEKFQGQIEDAAADIALQMGKASWIGSGASPLLAGVVGSGAVSATGVYAGINRATFSEWAGNNVTGVGALTLTALQQMERSIFNRSSRKPRAIITTADIADKYEALFASSVHMYPRGSAEATSETGLVLPGDDGFTGMNFRGIPIYRDPECPAGALLFFNDELSEMQSLPIVSPGDAFMATAMAARANDVSAMLGKGGGDLFVRCEALGKNGDSTRFQLIVYAQTCVKRPSAFGLIEGIT
jgi:hypothetical protein